MSSDEQLFDVDLETHGDGQSRTGEASTFGHASAHTEILSSYNFEDDVTEPNISVEMLTCMTNHRIQIVYHSPI